MHIITFHGSLNRSISRFHIATHFGARDQALSAIGAKRFLDEVKEGLPTLYKVAIDVPDSTLIDVKKDWGKFGAQGALVPIRELLESNAAPEEELAISRRFNSYHNRINEVFNFDRDAARCLAEKLLLEETQDGYKILKYLNQVECDGNGYCVIDPSLITIIEITSPSWLEVIAAFKNHGDWSLVKAEVENFSF